MTARTLSPVDTITGYALRQRLVSDGLQSKLDWAFFALAGVASGWLAWLVFTLGLHSGWWQIVFGVVFWLLLAYLVLPRLHRILTSIYVPNYFIGRTRTSDGLLGDPVNLSLRGDEAQIHAAMTAAGWIRADDISSRSSIRIITSTIFGRSYSEAPVSPLFLFGRKQDFAYQQEVDGSPGKRHHVRFWRCPDGWLLPGGTSVDWLAAGTYDRKVGFSAFTLQITHKIAPDVDVERDHIVESMTTAKPGITVQVLPKFATGYHSRNGGGDTIETDGDLPIINVSSVAGAGFEDAVEATRANPRPLSILLGAAMIWLGAAIEAVIAIALFTGDDQLVASLGDTSAVRSALQLTAWLVLLAALFKLFLGLLVFIGSSGARILVMGLTVLTLVLELSAVTATPLHLLEVSTVYPAATDILVLLALSSESATRFVRNAREQAIRRHHSTTS